MKYNLKVLKIDQQNGDPEQGSVVHTEVGLTEDQKSKRLTVLYRKYHLPCYQIVSERTTLRLIRNE